ncbi:uncharacterized protein LOC119096267 [Pollicipes pollicipes]|uniref:uncharacterized protein LOC119096267 n=1 Tax=Pollicipes pollicipes TaxID=41117 RepID=UPI00188575B7|nr:uncharacterized protein LOC119096267 [Pollicipes pollicipes]
MTARQSLAHRWLQRPPTLTPPEPGITPADDSTEDLSKVNNSPRNLRRSISKSREVLSVKVSKGNLKKNISKSRERLCDLKFSLPKSPDQFPSCLRASTSRLADGSGGRPPWKGAGAGGPTSSVSTSAMDRVNTFKVRDQYQSQVAAILSGSCQSLDGGPPPFVRHNSLRGRRKSSAQSGEPANLRSSLRRTRNKEGALNRKHSTQAEDCKLAPDSDKNKELGKRSVSSHDGSESILRTERQRRSSRNERLTSVEEKNTREAVVETLHGENGMVAKLNNDQSKGMESNSTKTNCKTRVDDDDEKDGIQSTSAPTHVLEEYFGPEGTEQSCVSKSEIGDAFLCSTDSQCNRIAM